MQPKLSRVLIMAGGTGGHVFPALATARFLQQQGVEIQWLGTPAGIESRIVPDAQIHINYIDVAGVRGQGIMRLLAAPLKIFRAVMQARAVIQKFKPDCVIGMGGFVTGPGGVAAFLSGVPLFIHEQNAVPGFTNRMLSHISRRVMQAFPDTFPPSSKVLTTGNPVRSEIASMPAPEQRWQHRDGRTRLLIVGGSQGAVALNKILPEAFSLLNHQQFEIMHQTGQKDAEPTRERYQSFGVEANVIPFIADMAAAYQWADAVICRSGALTVSELAAAGVGALLVPYPFAVDDHQTKNAEFLVKGGAAQLVQQKELTPIVLADLIKNRFSEQASLKSMALAARRLAQPDATEKLVHACVEALHA